MNRVFIFSFTCISLLAACNDGGEGFYKTEEISVDSAIAVTAPAEERVVAAPAADENPVSSKFKNLHGERSIAAILCQGWVMDDDVNVLQSNNDPEGNYPYRCIYFFDDNTYTRNIRNEMEYGSWYFSDTDKMITLQDKQGGELQYKIAAVGPDDMIVLNWTNQSATKLTFLADGIRYRNKKEDPFYIDNNRWRIKPAFSENEEQLKERLRQFLKFHILFYRDNLERKEKTISFYGFPTCLKWYGAGIGLINESELPDNWFACFYSKEQALQAQKMMSALLAKKYKWSKANVSWVQKNLEVLEQMYAAL